MTEICLAGMLTARWKTRADGLQHNKMGEIMSGISAKTLLVYCTCPDQAAGTELATALVKEGLAGCINVLPGITSIYKWHGQMKTGTEALLLIKTPTDKYPALESAIRTRHPYELPEIIAVSLDAGLPDYLNWIRDETDI